jgi:hypothetical protein
MRALPSSILARGLKAIDLPDQRSEPLKPPAKINLFFL